MAILKLTQKVQKSGLTVKISSAVLDDLKRYADYTNATTNEIVQQALAYVFEKDTEFQKWKEHPAPAPVTPVKGRPNGKPVVVSGSKPLPGSDIAS